MTFLEHILAAIADTEKNGQLVELPDISGLSGSNIIGLLQRFGMIAARHNSGCYIEVGVYQGLTLTSVAAAVPELACYGIDNFSQFDEEGVNEAVLQTRLERYTDGNACFINADFEDALLDLDDVLDGSSVSVYFVDGPHDYRSQYLSLDYMRQHLSNDSVIVVDDANYEHVRQANCDWLCANRDYALVFEGYTRAHPNNLTEAELVEAKRGWWNGVNVLVHDNEYQLERIYPQTGSCRNRYLNDHLIHSSAYADSAVRITNSLAEPLFLGMVRWLSVKFGHSGRRPFRLLNTDSDQLCPRRVARLR